MDKAFYLCRITVNPNPQTDLTVPIIANMPTSFVFTGRDVSIV